MYHGLSRLMAETFGKARLWHCACANIGVTVDGKVVGSRRLHHRAGVHRTTGVAHKAQRSPLCTLALQCHSAQAVAAKRETVRGVSRSTKSGADSSLSGAASPWCTRNAHDVLLAPWCSGHGRQGEGAPEYPRLERVGGAMPMRHGRWSAGATARSRTLERSRRSGPSRQGPSDLFQLHM